MLSRSLSLSENRSVEKSHINVWVGVRVRVRVCACARVLGYISGNGVDLQYTIRELNNIF